MVVFYVFLKHELLICFAYSTHLAAAAALSFFPNWYARAQIPLSAFLHFLFCTLLPLERERNTVSRTTLMKLPLWIGDGKSLIRLWNSVRQIEWKLSSMSIFKIFSSNFQNSLFLVIKLRTPISFIIGMSTSLLGLKNQFAFGNAEICYFPFFH